MEEFCIESLLSQSMHFCHSSHPYTSYFVNLKMFQLIAGFAVSAQAPNAGRIGKPFNPLLGETYELIR